MMWAILILRWGRVFTYNQLCLTLEPCMLRLKNLEYVAAARGKLVRAFGEPHMRTIFFCTVVFS